MRYFIDAVESPSRDSSALVGWSVDLPRPAQRGDGYLLEVAGWVVGRLARVRNVSIRQGPSIGFNATMGVPRPDGQRAFTGISDDLEPGFNALILLPSVPANLRLDVVATLDGGLSVPIARIRGHHNASLTCDSDLLGPLMVTTLGRTGSSRLMQLLSRHPGIVVHPTFGHEMAAARHWCEQLRDLTTRPHGLTRAQAFDARPEASSWGPENPFSDVRMRSWFETDQVERTASWCRAGLDGTYRTMAAAQEKGGATRFAEKFLPDDHAWLVHAMYPHGREVVLVRDPRDMVCSVLAFNAKRGFSAFSRENVRSDEEYPALLASDLGCLATVLDERPSALLVRYESLVSRPAATLRRILDHADVDSSRTVIEAMLAPPATPDDLYHRTTPDTDSSVGRWRRDLTPSMIHACELAFAESLVRFGYAEAA